MMDQRTFSSWALTASMTLALVGCDRVLDITRDSNRPSTHARLQVIHTVSTWASMELRLDGVLLGAFTANAVSPVFEFSPGTYSVAVRFNGAHADLWHLEDLDFAVQAYVMAFFDGDDGVEALLLDERPPGLSKGEAAVQILGMFSTDAELDVYMDGNVVAPALAHGDVTGFVIVPSGSRQVALRRQGDSPNEFALAIADVKFDDAQAAVLVVRQDNLTLRFTQAKLPY